MPTPRRLVSPRRLISPRRWKRQRHKKKFNEKRKSRQGKYQQYLKDDVTPSGRWASIARESSDRCRNIDTTSESQRERFIKKRPSLWELSGGTHQTTRTTAHSANFVRPEWSTTSMDSGFVEILVQEKPKCKTPYMVSSEDWSTTSSASEFVHLKPEKSSSKLRHASSIKQLMLDDMRQKLGDDNYESLDELKFPRETSGTSVCQLNLENEKEIPPNFTNLATWRVKKEKEVDFQISMWKVRTSSTKHITLESLNQFDRIVIEKTSPKYTFIQTSKLVPCY